MHIGATWQIRLNDCALTIEVVMLPVAKIINLAVLLLFDIIPPYDGRTVRGDGMIDR